MFARAYYAARYFAARFFPQSQGEEPEAPDLGGSMRSVVSVRPVMRSVVSVRPVIRSTVGVGR